MPTGTLSICSAGHPTPLIRRAVAGNWEALEIPEANNEITGDIPLGIGESSYTQAKPPKILRALVGPLSMLFSVAFHGLP